MPRINLLPHREQARKVRRREFMVGAGGAVVLECTRRARGAWLWLDGVDAPLVEEREAYLVGFGPVEAPHAEWQTAEPSMRLDGATRASLAAAYPDALLWVRQVGRLAQSDALSLGRLA